MKFDFNFDSDKVIATLYVVVIAIILFGGPAVFIAKTITTQQAINQECKTNYSVFQVALAGDNLSRICQLKNQTLSN